MASLHDVTVGQDIEFKRVLAKAGMNSDMLEAVIKRPELAEGMVGWLHEQLSPPAPEPIMTDFVSLAVDGSKTSRLLKSGVFDEHSSNITDYNFPNQRQGKETIEVTLLNLDQWAATEDVIVAGEACGLVPLTESELLAWAARDHSLGRQFCVVALGQYWVDSDDRNIFGCVFGSPDWRSADIRWTYSGARWAPSYRFAFRRK
jgi:hypothetical protein